MLGSMMILMFRDMKFILLCATLLSYPLETCGGTSNTPAKDNFHHIKPDLIFLEIANRNVSPQSLRNLNIWMQKLDKNRRDDVICFFNILKEINHTPEKKILCLIEKLDSILKRIVITPGISDYIIYSIYLRQGERFADVNLFKIAYKYLEKSAQNGCDKAILEWGKHRINSKADLDDIKKCVLLLKKIDSYESETRVMIFLSRITLLYCCPNLTGISSKNAFNTIFNNKDSIHSSCLSPLLEAGVMCLLIPELQQECDRGMVLLREYVNKTENIEMLLKLIYVSKSNNLETGDLSALCCKKVNELITNHDSRQTGSIFLSNKGWGNAETLTALNQGADFIDVCLGKFRETLKDKRMNIRQFMFFQQ